MEEFKNLAELKNKSLQFDEAEFRDIFNEDGEKQEGYRGVYNKTRNELITIKRVTGHKLIQHKEAVDVFIDTSLSMNLSFKGKVIDSGNKVAVQFIANTGFLTSTNEEVKQGIVLFNEYGKGLFLGWQGVNLSCTNQMNANFTRSAIRIPDTIMLGSKLKEAITDIMDSNDQIKQYVEKAIADSMEWDYATQIIGLMIYEKKHRESIIKILEENKKDKISRWDLYNAITNYATHGENITSNVEDYLQNSAQRVLVDIRFNKLKTEVE